MEQHRLTLSTRVILTNGVLFALGTALLAFSPATVSPEPVVSEVVVLVFGLSVMILANALLVRASLRPLDQLLGDIAAARGSERAELLPVPDRAPAHDLAQAINDLLVRIEEGRRERDVAALAAQEAERARIAQELHDGVGQSLTAVLLGLGRLDDPSLEPVREGVRNSLDEVRRVARQLRPHVLEDLGLTSALTSLTTELFADQDTRVQRGINPGLPPLDEAVELVVFRVAQEALTNVARHARAGEVALTLGMKGDHLVLTVADDGIGIPPGATGTGLRGMAERAALVGGRVRVSRGDGGGTRVTLEVPLEGR